MEVVEIRDLDGPNIFLPMPAIKIEVANILDSDLASLRAALDAVEGVKVGLMS